ncbi:MAG: DUF2309 domain-containing protein [Planctomycetaceae bacterium]|nr:DUF2309 domain-containing protein [Planctomycetaceae bacterium]
MTAVYQSANAAVPAESTEQLLRRLAELLPLQGPITAFAFLNPLQGMENQPFIEALRQVEEIYGCEPFLPEGAYRKKMAQGRISVDDLTEILAEDPGYDGDRQVGGIVRCAALRLSMLQHSINPGTEHELHWVIAETNALLRFRSEISHSVRERMIDSTRRWVADRFPFSTETNHLISADELTGVVRDAIPRSMFRGSLTLDENSWETITLALLWQIIKARIEGVPNEVQNPVRLVRHRDLLLKATREDSDRLVHEVLIQFCAVFLDQGYAQWKLPTGDTGFFQSFLSLFSTGGYFAKRWLRPVQDEVRRIQRCGQTALESLEESLILLGVGSDDKECFIRSSLLALRGWAGMIWQTEDRPDRVYRPSRQGTLIEYLAVRLILERFALAWLSHETLGYAGSLDRLRETLRSEVPENNLSATTEQRAYPILQLAQLHGWTPQLIADLTEPQWQELVQAVERFSPFERRRVFHQAFERRLLRHTLDCFSIRASQPRVFPENPKLQVFSCIDAREESYRRHMEEVAPEVETFGNAGFFGVAMYYRGAGDATYTTLCPIVVKPLYWMVEDVVYALADSGRQRARARRLLGTATHSFNTGTRGSITGAVLTALLGPLFTAPLVGRILFPRITARMHRTARGFVAPPPVTRLRLEREEGTPAGPDEKGIGFTLSEMANMAERALRDIGLTQNFAPLVVIQGHGSDCLNNPHESAYHCGACSGGRGGPNARAMAAMLNDPRVRRELAARGLNIPEETRFVGAMHNTATDAVKFYDLELLPASHMRHLHYAVDIFDRVAERNAHERCRRFETAPLDFSPAEALQHVDDRSEDLAQTRPEYGNSTNAICFVGRRSRIRGMYLDRRSFLMSYDASQDTDNSMILARILGAVIPVCEGINMLYTLSSIDTRGFGSGTKLPHNVTSLLGVMDGAASDLRPGLPWQGVDIHEPVRLLFIIESTSEAMLRIMNDNPTVGRICRNEWAQLAVLDPNSNRIQRFVKGTFVDYEPTTSEMATAESSLDWYRGWRDNLPFALIKGK